MLRAPTCAHPKPAVLQGSFCIAPQKKRRTVHGTVRVAVGWARQRSFAAPRVGAHNVLGDPPRQLRCLRTSNSPVLLIHSTRDCFKLPRVDVELRA